MEKLIIKHNDDVIFEGDNIYGIKNGMDPKETRDTILKYMHDNGAKFDHFMDDFGILDNSVDNGDCDNINIIVE